MHDINDIRTRIATQRPLVHHITNWVTIYGCAAATRAFGALPVMAHAREEVEEMVSHAGALVLNIGTLTPEMVDLMMIAGRKANSMKIPVVLDAVGAGATELRTGSCRKMLQSVHIDILKGNAGEIGTLACMGAEVKGVESISVAGDPVDAAASLAAAHRCVVVITGKEDIVTDGKRAIFVKNGHPLMGHVVGTGCMAASAIGCFAAVEKDHLSAAAAALVSYGIAGEDAAKKASGPGTFIEHLIDAIASLDDKTIRRRALIEERTATER